MVFPYHASSLWHLIDILLLSQPTVAVWNYPAGDEEK